MLPGILFPGCPLQQSDPQKKQRMKLNNRSFAALKNVHYGDYEFALAFAFALASLKWGSFSLSTKGKLISVYPVDISFLFIR